MYANLQWTPHCEVNREDGRAVYFFSMHEKTCAKYLQYQPHWEKSSQMYLYKLVPQLLLRIFGGVVWDLLLSQLAGDPLHLILIKKACHLTTNHQFV